MDLRHPDRPRAPRGPAAAHHAAGPPARRRRAPPERVMYANAHVLNQSAGNAELRAALEAADLVYCDGYGVRLAAKALDAPIPHRMTGADWIWGLAALCEQVGRVDLPARLRARRSPRGAAERLAATYPRLDVVGHHHGYFEVGSPHDDRVVEDINARRPSILLVGHGDAEAGAVGAGQRPPPRRRRAVDRRRAVRRRLGQGPAGAGLVGRQWTGMDLQVGDRARPDVAALPPGQPGVRPPGDEPGPRAPRRRAPEAARARRAQRRSPRSSVADYAGVAGPGAVDDVAARRRCAACALFARRGLRRRRGCCCPPALRAPRAAVGPAGRRVRARRSSSRRSATARAVRRQPRRSSLVGGAALGVVAVRRRGLPARPARLGERRAGRRGSRCSSRCVALVPMFRGGLRDRAGQRLGRAPRRRHRALPPGAPADARSRPRSRSTACRSSGAPSRRSTTRSPRSRR